jgi:hypothetical protein
VKRRLQLRAFLNNVSLNAHGLAVSGRFSCANEQSAITGDNNVARFVK